MNRIHCLYRAARNIFTVLGLVVMTGCSSISGKLPESPFLRTLERKSGKIVFLALDGNLYTTDQGGLNTVQLTSDAEGLPSEGSTQFYQFPTWSSDGSKLAFAKIKTNGVNVDGISLFTANRDGSELVEVFSSSEDLPVYLFWSPDDEFITYLSVNVNSQVFSINLIPASGGEIQKLVEGPTLYWDWHPRNNVIALHQGGDSFAAEGDKLALLDIGGAITENELDQTATLFKAPAYSPDGEELLMAVKNKENENVLMIMDEDGKPKEEMAIVEGPVAFGWSPDGEKISYIDKKDGASPFYYGHLMLFDKSNPEEVTTIGDAVLGFFWSPDGEKIAYFEPLILTEGYAATGVENEEGMMRLNVLDVSSGKSKNVYEFLPLQTMANLVASSDQFQQSTTIWSPDSRKLVVLASGEEGEPQVMVVDATGSLEPRPVAEGVLAYWSWR